MRFLLLTALCALHFAAAVDVRFSTLVAERAVVPFDISVQYKNDDKPDYVDYTSCFKLNDKGEYVRDDSLCPALNWDDNAFLRVTITRPAEGDLSSAAVSNVGSQQLADPVKFKVRACFDTPYTKNRKWRKVKDIIQDDKRCSKDIIKKRDLPAPGESYVKEYEVPSDMPGADFFLTLFVFCKEANSDGDQYCALDTTGPLSDLAKKEDLEKRGVANDDVDALQSQTTSDRFYFRTTTVDSRPPALIISVILLSCLSVTLLVLYFVYERIVKKTA